MSERQPTTPIDSCGHHQCWSCGACFNECDMCDCFWQRAYGPDSGVSDAQSWIDYGKTWAQKERDKLELELDEIYEAITDARDELAGSVTVNKEPLEDKMDAVIRAFWILNAYAAYS